MIIENLLWVTDIHLNFLEEPERFVYYKNLAEQGSDALLISGDIGEAHSVFLYLEELASVVEQPIYFVLGNHDYYRGSVAEIHEKMQNCAEINPQLHWLGNGECVSLNSKTILMGIDAWADGRYGDFLNSPVLVNDSRLIADLFIAKLMSKTNLQKKMSELADEDAEILNKNLMRSIKPTTTTVLICVHVPPFAESCTFEGEPTNEDWLPFYSSKATGDVIFSWAEKNPQIMFKVFCGHTHNRHQHSPLKNLTVKVGQATYGRPEIQEIIKV